MKMDDGDANETLAESEEREENVNEGEVDGEDSSDSEDSDGNEAVIDPRIQQLELQVSLCSTCAYM